MRRAHCPNKKPDSWVTCVFPGAWRRVLEGACWGADVREDSKRLRDQERAWYKGWLGQADAQTGGALLILKHTSLSNWPRLTQHVSNLWLLLPLCLSLSLVSLLSDALSSFSHVCVQSFSRCCKYGWSAPASYLGPQWSSLLIPTSMLPAPPLLPPLSFPICYLCVNLSLA